MQAVKSLTNLQLELLEVFKYDLSDIQLNEIRTLLANYFADKMDKEIDQLFKENNWDANKIEEWANEHMRFPSNSQ
jgi:hypothetical protein